MILFELRKYRRFSTQNGASDIDRSVDVRVHDR